MSTNCIRCVVNKRVGPYLYCEECLAADAPQDAREQLKWIKGAPNKWDWCLYQNVNGSTYMHLLGPSVVDVARHIPLSTILAAIESEDA